MTRTILEGVLIAILIFFVFQFVQSPEPEIETETVVEYLPSPPIVLRDTVHTTETIVVVDTVMSETGEPEEYERVADEPIETTYKNEDLTIHIQTLPLRMIDEVNIGREFIAYKGLWLEFLEYRGLHFQPRSSIIKVDIQLPPVEVHHTTTTIREQPSLAQKLQWFGYGVGGGILITLLLQ